MAVSSRDLDLMAWTLLGEAAGEGPQGMQAVANVIVNRTKSGGYPTSIGEVVLQKSPKGTYQFTAWSPKYGNNPQGTYSKSSEAFKKARAIAEQVVNGQLPDLTGGAVNYWAPRGMEGGKDPKWAVGVPDSQRLRIGNHVFLASHPVPKAPLGNDPIVAQTPPVPATLSPAMAYARGLADPGAALAAIEAATSGNVQQLPYGTAAYAGGGLDAVARPAATGLPYGPQPKPPLEFTPASTDPDSLYAGIPGIQPPAPPPIPARQDPYEQMFADARQSIASNKALENIPFASDERLKQLAAAKSGDGLLTQASPGADQYNPMQGFGANAGGDLTTRVVKTIPITGDTSVFDAAMAQQGAEAQIKPRLTLSDIMGTARPAAGAVRTAGTEYVRPDGTTRMATMAGSNDQPLPGRPSILPPAPPASPLLGDGPRSVANLVTPTNTIPANTGVGFGQTPVGTLPGMGVTADPAVLAPKPLTRPEAPAVNSKGYFLGNPFGDYAVKKGDTLAKIAKRFETSVYNLAQVNNIPDPAKIKAGARLVVPNPSVAPVTPAPRPASRTSSSSSSSSGSTASNTIVRSTPTTYTPPKQTTTSATKVSIPVYSSASITPTKVATQTTPTGSTITQAQMNAIRGLKEGGPVQKYATGSAVLDWSGGADYQANLEKALKQVDAARNIANITPIGALTNSVANTFFPDQTQQAVWNTAQAIAAPKSGTTTSRTTTSRTSSPMMDGSPSTASRSTSTGKGSRDSTKTDSTKSGSGSASGGIDGLVGTYTPPTMAQINAMYAPYFRQAQFPTTGYDPGVSGEFNYFPMQQAPATTPAAGTPAAGSNPLLSAASTWLQKYLGGDRAAREAARKELAQGKTTFYSLYDRFRDTLKRGTTPTPEAWQAWLTSKGYGTGATGATGATAAASNPLGAYLAQYGYAEGGSVSEPRLVLGKGGPTSDDIPAKIDNRTEARLSNGEFVMTAAAVRGLGGGDYGKGAEALMRLNDQFDPRHNRGTLKVEKVR